MDNRVFYTELPATAAVTPTEHLLVRVWQEVLDVTPVGRDDNFLELGGTSMLAVHAVARIQAEFGSSPSSQLLLEAESLADVAADIDSTGGPQN